MLFQPVNPLVTRLQYIYLSNEAGLISKIFSSIQTINNKWIINSSPRIIGNFKKNWDRVFEQQHDSNIVKSDGVFGNDFRAFEFAFKIMFLDEHRTCKFFSTVCTEPSIKIKLCIWCYNGKGDGECVALNFSKSKTMTLENVFARYSDVERWLTTLSLRTGKGFALQTKRNCSHVVYRLKFCAVATAAFDAGTAFATTAAGWTLCTRHFHFEFGHRNYYDCGFIKEFLWRWYKWLMINTTQHNTTHIFKNIC